MQNNKLEKLKLTQVKSINKDLSRNAFLIGGLSLVSSFLGMIRDRLLASKFGAGDVLDIYYAAFRLPDLVFNILIFGALSSTFVPIFSNYLSKNKNKALRLAGTILNWVLITITSVSFVCIVFAPFLISLVVPGFEGEKFEKTVTLTRILFFSPILLSISSVFSGFLTTKKSFLIYSLAPIMYNIGIISGIILFSKKFDVSGLGFAVVMGAFLHMLVQLPTTLKKGFRFNFVLKIEKEILNKFKKLIIPRSLSLLINQLNLLFITMIASTLMKGSLAMFNLANNLAGIPLTIFGAPFAVAAFTDLSFFYNKNKMKDFVDLFSKTLIRISFFVIPTTVVMLSLRAQLVRLFFGAGAFNWEDTELTFQILGFLALSLFFQSSIPLVSRAFFAIHDTLTPFLSGLLSVAINLILSILLTRDISWGFIEFESMGISGIALAYSISQALNLILMLIILYLKLGGFNDFKIISNVLKITFASLLMGASIQLTKEYSGFFLEYATLGLKSALNTSTLEAETFLKIFLQTTLSCLIGGSVYLWVSWYIGVMESNTILKKFKSVVYNFYCMITGSNKRV